MSSGTLLAWVGLTIGLTLVPGADVAVVLRTALRSGPVAAIVTGFGVSVGVLAWGIAAAAGLAALVTASRLAYDVLRIAGAAYLIWLGIRTFRSRGGLDLDGEQRAPTPSRGGLATAFGAGLVTNLLNPKIGVFYLSVLPQFLPADGISVAWGTLLAGIHVAEGTVWFVVLALGVQRARALLSRPRVARTVDRVVGTGLVGLGLRLAVSAR